MFHVDWNKTAIFNDSLVEQIVGMKHHHLTGNVHYLNQLFSLLVGAQFAEQSLADIYIRTERRQHFVVHRCVELFQKLVVFLLLLELYER